MPRSWEEEKLEGMRLEDRLASFILAIMHSSDHVEVSVNAGGLAHPSQRALAERVAEERVRRGIHHGLSTVQALQSTMARAQGDAKLADELSDLARRNAGRVRRLAESIEERQRQLARQSNEAFARDILAQAPSTIVYNPLDRSTRAGHSEIGFRTVAVSLLGSTLYVAFNYRRDEAAPTPGNPFNKRKTGFNELSPEANRRLFLAISRELSRERESKDGDPAFAGIQQVIFLRGESTLRGGASRDEKGVLDERAAETYAAECHAEMILVKALGRNCRYLGVTKSCCKKCGTVLRGLGIGFRVESNIPEDNIKNWIPPDGIELFTRWTYRLTRVPRRM